MKSWIVVTVIGLLCTVSLTANAQVFSCLNITSEMAVGQKAVLKNVIHSCRDQMKSAQCDDWFRSHPQALVKARSCDPVKVCSVPQQIKGFAESCSSGVWNSSVDLVKGAIHFVVGSTGASPEVKAREDFFRSCTTPECKLAMLGRYADLFSIEEIIGTPNTQGLNPKDVVNAVYLNGYSAKTLYRKLQDKLRERAKDKDIDDVFIEPWSGNPALPKRSVEELIEEVLTAAGMQNTACFDPEVVIEARCYALASVLDPLAASVAVMRVEKIATLLRASERKSMGKAAAKDEYIRTQVMRGSAIDSAKLKSNMDPIWADAKLTSEQKVQTLFDKYYELRRSAMDGNVQKLSDKVMADVQYTKGSSAGYNMISQKMYVGKELAGEPLTHALTLAHELEHVTQYPYKTGLIKQFANSLEQKIKKLDKPRGVTSRLQAEFEAMSAQWDIIQSVPLEVRAKAIETLRSNQKLNPQAKASAIADIERANLTRAEYLKTVAASHGYTTYQAQQTKHTLIASALLVHMSVVGIDDAITQRQRSNSSNAH